MSEPRALTNLESGQGCAPFPLFPLFTLAGRPSTNSTCPRGHQRCRPAQPRPTPCVSGLARRLQCESQKREGWSGDPARIRAMLRWPGYLDIPETCQGKSNPRGLSTGHNDRFRLDNVLTDPVSNIKSVPRLYREAPGKSLSDNIGKNNSMTGYGQ